MSHIRWYLAAALSGYLVGSVSATRLLARVATPGADLSTTEYPIDSQGSLVSHG